MEMRVVSDPEEIERRRAAAEPAFAAIERSEPLTEEQFLAFIAWEASMPRIRTLKPECLSHRKVGRLSDRAFRLWVGMILQADDEGRLVADPEALRVTIWGYHRQVTADHVSQALAELGSAGLIRIYSVEGTQYADFPSWRDHQRVGQPVPSKLPSFNDSRKFSNVLDVSSLRGTEGKEGKGREGKGREGKGNLIGREGKGREGKGTEGKGREGNGTERNGTERKGTERKGRERI